MTNFAAKIAAEMVNTLFCFMFFAVNNPNIYNSALFLLPHSDFCILHLIEHGAASRTGDFFGIAFQVTGQSAWGIRRQLGTAALEIGFG